MPVGLVLEGGGLRGWYTSGVLTALNEKQIEFPVVYGVSAGALNALPFISKQVNQKSAVAYMKNMRDRRFMGMGNLRRTGSFFGFDYMLNELPHQFPFDYETFFHSPVGLKIGTTNLATGKSVYFSKTELDENFTPIKASCSLPFLANIVQYRDYDLLDGGCSEPIPIERSIKDGNDKNIIVLTQDASYREKPGSRFSCSVLHKKYGRYPNFVCSMERHAPVYNREIALCEYLEKTGKAIVIRPRYPLAVSRCDRNTERLLQMYRMGVCDCKRKFPKILKFIS